jgi:hypothetical protein
MLGLENTTLRANIVIHIFISHWYTLRNKNNYKVCVFANKIFCLWTDSNTEPLNKNYGEQ